MLHRNRSLLAEAAQKYHFVAWYFSALCLTRGEIGNFLFCPPTNNKLFDQMMNIAMPSHDQLFFKVPWDGHD